ncbi:MAG: hypothetical protein AB7T27_03775 [Kiritimatiellia bacterium]
MLEDLKYFLDEEFPKSCDCGEVYYSMEDFIERTREVPLAEVSGTGQQGSGVQGLAVNIVRQCRCGVRMVIDFSSRRDRSPKGNERRQMFGDLLTFFTNAGMPPATARDELLKVVHGQQSSDLIKILREANIDKLNSLSLSIQLRMLKDYLRC